MCNTNGCAFNNTDSDCGDTHTMSVTDDAMYAEYNRAYALIANAPEAWDAKSKEELDKSARTLVKNGFAYPANTLGRALHMGQADALTDIYGANQR